MTFNHEDIGSKTGTESSKDDKNSFIEEASSFLDLKVGDIDTELLELCKQTTEKEESIIYQLLTLAYAIKGRAALIKEHATSEVATSREPLIES